MHTLISNPTEAAIRRGIKTVGIGKKGSHALEPQLLEELLIDLQQQKVSSICLGAFLAGLYIKGIAPHEMILEAAFPKGTLTDPTRLAQWIASDTPFFIQDICRRLLNGQTLNQKTARRLGDFLFSDLPGEGARGFVASLLRVRYETPDEYAGLLLSLNHTFLPAFQNPPPAGDPILQFAEPFDGVDHSYLITPLLAEHFQNQKWRVVYMVGRNSGPKNGINLLDLALGLQGNFLKGSADFEGTPCYGWFLNQADLSFAMDQWVERRREIIKRPFLSTLEKFVNPFKADILITSAFHPPYTEKMITIAERAGFPGAIIIRNGLEGTIAFALKRNVKIMCTARQTNGTYLRYEFEVDPQQTLQTEIDLEEKLEQPQLSENINLIETYQRQGSSGRTLFDLRVQLSCVGIDQALQWICNHSSEIKKVGS